MTDFRKAVLTVVRRIPPGQTLSYKEVARPAGTPRAPPAVGALMRANYNFAIPCHRVVRSDGSLGGYNRGGSTRKAALLEREARRAGPELS
ncbi:MAG: MGMT family protein [Candidatus Paceibacterota bacterium]